MILILLLLWGTLAVSFFYNDKSRFSIWYLLLIFCITLGLFCEIIRVDIVPLVDNKELFDLFARFLSVCSYRLSPYFTILIGVEMYCQDQHKTKINIALFMPIIMGFVCDILYPNQSFIVFLPDLSPTFWTIVVWAIPYGIVANVLTIMSYCKEKSPRIKHKKMLIVILVLPTLIFMYSAYLSPIFLHSHPFYINFIADVIILSLILIFAVKYGVMGIKISFEKEKLDITMNAISTGTAILIHSLKNELNNIEINSECLEDVDPAKISIQKSTERILAIIRRMNKEFEQIKIEKRSDNLSRLLEDMLDSLSKNLNANNIKLVKNLQDNLIAKYDSIFLKEALFNIIQNAVEAMNNGGILDIYVGIVGKYVVIKVKDTGIGIEENNISRVIEPFFSTKLNTKKNFGLGLTSSYRIIQKHQGVMEFITQKGKGTTVLIKIPSN